MFWPLYFIKRDLVVPDGVELIDWLDHIQHTLVSVAIIIEHLISHHERPKAKHSFISLMTFVFLYMIWVHYIGFVKHYWVYGILGDLNWFLRIIFLVGCVIFVTFLYFVGGWLHKFAWSEHRTNKFYGVTEVNSNN